MKMVTKQFCTTLALLAMSSVVLSACEKDEFDPQTWIAKLDDPAEVKEAITKLKQLKCPEAIKPLAKTWEKHNKWSRVLRVIIALADQPLMVKGYKVDGESKFPNQDCPDAGEGPYWKDAIPVLVTAVETFDVTDSREIQDAAVAAEALGKAKSKDALQVLISAATKKEKLRQGQMVRIAAIQALGAYGHEPTAVDTLIKLVGTKANVKTLHINAAAANSLANSGSKKAIVPLLKALYEVPPIYQQVRTALTTIGKPAVPQLLKVFEGTQTEINKIATDNKFAIHCDEAQGPGTSCIAPGNLRFKAATLLGDMRVKRAIKPMIAALKNKPAISFFDPKTGAPGPADHNAIIDALRKMGAYSAASTLLTYMQADDTNPMIRPLAIDAYSMLAKDTKALDYLKKVFQDQGRPMPEREAATLAYARLVKTDAQIAPIQTIIDLQLKSAKDSDAKAKKAKKEKAKKELNGTANDYRGFARQYEQQRTRARAGVVCKQNLACYRELLTLDGKGIATKLKIPNHRAAGKKMKKKDMQTYRIAALERALLEIAKMGKKARPALPDLLKHVESSDRIIRQGVLLALVQAAPTPCNACVDRLEKVIKSQSGQSTMTNLTADTRVVLNYFISAGGKGGGAAAVAAPAQKKKSAPKKSAPKKAAK